MVFPTSEQHEIRAGGCNAMITEVSARLRSFIIDGTEILVTHGPDRAPKGWGGTHPSPWPNRLRDGHYHLGGQEFQPPINESSQSNANYDLNVGLAWECLARPGTSVYQRCVLWLRRGRPGIFAMEILYQLEARGLRVGVTTTDIGTMSTPWGYGVHPYFRSKGISGVELTAPFDVELVVGPERPLPIRLGPVAPAHDFVWAHIIGEAVLGATFTGPLTRDWTVTLNEDGRTIKVQGKATIQWVQVFTAPHRDNAAVEPTICGPDAFNEGPTYRDRTMLRPRESIHAAWGIRATLRSVSQFGGT